VPLRNKNRLLKRPVGRIQYHAKAIAVQLLWWRGGEKIMELLLTLQSAVRIASFSMWLLFFILDGGSNGAAFEQRQVTLTREQVDSHLGQGWFCPGIARSGGPI
jgi:hypothetical protein